MLRSLLECLDDGCGQSYNSKCCCVELSDGNTVFIIKQLLGHPMHCASNACNSLLRLLCAGAVHYPALRTLLQQLYCARQNSALIDQVELDLSSVDCIPLSKQNLRLEDLAVLLEYDEFSSSVHDPLITSFISEQQLHVHSQIITFNK